MLGSTTNNNIVFAQIEIRNKYTNHFTVCFTEVCPFIASEEVMEELAEWKIEELAIDLILLTELLNYYDCTSENLHEYLMKESVDELIDISLYPKSYVVAGINDPIYFESDAYGQHNTRKKLIPIDKEFSDWLHKMWDEYHMCILTKKLRESTESKITEYIEKLGSEEDWIQNWLETEVYPE